ncbi:MAG: FecR domain-containing protein [Acidobacteria bacterium]|nr:FecR domain-containing protein [Acidobacteriota bacterium]
MRSPRPFLWVTIFLLPLILLLNQNASGVVYDDYTPEVTARVVRISVIRGDVQIRRSGENQAWEKATLNLPIVEGDELTTGADSRIEIQFDKDSYLRLSEYATLKITTLRDEGVALSLPQGTMSLRVLNFDKERNYYEIDAPSTTVSVERAGMYRIDAGDTRGNEIRVAVTQGGEARVYSQNSGFTLKNGRSAKLFLSGNFAGEWETGDASRYADDFDTWVMERESAVAKRLRDSYYDKYYDRDIYGAEDLNEYGEWIYTRKYGYVWRPFRSATSGYTDWSPYRYGHWRWVSFYGWTWVNDEPWGWATYHHGRWIWDDGYWHWSPYANSRWRRSWWRPAMVSIVTWNGSVCWYPLSYYDSYYDYNSYYYRRNRGNVRIYNNTTIINNNTTVVVNPTPNPTPNNQPVTNETREDRLARLQTPPLQRIPPGAVVSVDSKEFGRRTGGYKTPPFETGKTILSKVPDDNQTPPILPDYKDLDRKISKEILIENPREPATDKVKTGAMERKPGASMDEDLRKQRIFGNRIPVTPKTEPNETGGGIIVNPNSETRKTGAVNRPLPKQEDNETKQPPVFNPGPVRTTGGGKRDDDGTQDQKPVQRERQREEKQSPPIYVPPQPKQEERRERPTFPQQQRNEKPREEPRQQPQPKPREEPRQQPQPKPREEPRPQPRIEPKSEPKPEQKPSPKQNPDKSEKDNRR